MECGRKFSFDENINSDEINNSRSVKKDFIGMLFTIIGVIGVFCTTITILLGRGHLYYSGTSFFGVIEWLFSGDGQGYLISEIMFSIILIIGVYRNSKKIDKRLIIK